MVNGISLSEDLPLSYQGSNLGMPANMTRNMTRGYVLGVYCIASYFITLDKYTPNTFVACVCIQDEVLSFILNTDACDKGIGGVLLQK